MVRSGCIKEGDKAEKHTDWSKCTIITDEIRQNFYLKKREKETILSNSD